MNALVLIIQKYRYLALFPLAAFEGPIISLVVGFLIHSGYLAILPSYAMLVLGDIIPDTIYYYVGRFGEEKNLISKYASKEGFIANNFPLVEKLWEKHGFKTMFLSKIAYGLSTIFLVSAGLVKMPLKRFLTYTIPITLFQYGVIMTIGYYLGQSYEAASKYIEYTGYFAAGIVVILIVVYIILSKYARKKLIEEVKEDK